MRLLFRSIRLLLIGRHAGYRAAFFRALRRTPPPSEQPAAQSEDPPAALPKRFICERAELSETEPYEAYVDGQSLVLFLHDGAVIALSGDCPHAGSPLGDGQIDAGQITCEAHGWTFDCATGLSPMCSNTALERWETTVQDDRIYLLDKKFVAES